jgi:hypothetical protein
MLCAPSAFKMLSFVVDRRTPFVPRRDVEAPLATKPLDENVTYAELPARDNSVSAFTLINGEEASILVVPTIETTPALEITVAVFDRRVDCVFPNNERLEPAAAVTVLALIISVGPVIAIFEVPVNDNVPAVAMTGPVELDRETRVTPLKNISFTEPSVTEFDPYKLTSSPDT